jgi:tRNA nucleotidyltransferase (CCA-adding enzyme)
MVLLSTCTFFTLCSPTNHHRGQVAILLGHMSITPVTPRTGNNPLLIKAQAVARAALRQGGRAFLVGGYVRDELLGLSPKDADLEVYGIEAGALRDMLRRFGRVNCVGESFRVYKLVWHGEGERYELDVSLPRRDRKVGEGHRGFEVEGDPFATIEDAARRRDFTINAILRDPLTGEIIDPFNGRTDLENRVLRAVHAVHFAEDSLRVLRAMQFAARFEMSIEPGTLELCRNIPLDDLPKERIWGEWEKMLLKAENPSIGLKAAHELCVLEKLFPALFTYFKRWSVSPCLEAGGWLGLSLDAAALEKRGLPSEKQIALMLSVITSHISSSAIEPFLDSLNIHTLNSYNVREQVLALTQARSKAFFAHCDEHPQPSH